jgi:hypothetical protein
MFAIAVIEPVAAIPALRLRVAGLVAKCERTGKRGIAV